MDSVLLRVQFLLGFLVVWMFAATASSATYLIPWLLGEEWERSIPLFQLLAVGGAVQVFSTVSYWAFVAHQQARQLFLYNLVTKSLAIVLVLVGAFFGLEFVALAYSVGLLISWPINLFWLRRTTGQDSWAYFRGGARLLLAGGVAFVIARLLESVVAPLADPIATILLALLATLVYSALIVILPGGGARVKMLADTARSLRRQKSG